jgi:hypothetical protein
LNSSPLDEAIAAREITEVLHFTTSSGLLGTLVEEQLLSHSRLPTAALLEHILKINCPDRSRDTAWHSYANLSISRPNGTLFTISRNKWHPNADIFWCILSFAPEIMTHPGVVFTTTNNAYDDYVERGVDVDGFEALFTQRIRQFSSKWVTRSKSLPLCHTTCHQAEVLYPEGVPIRYLQRVYLYSEDNYHEVQAQIGLCAPSFAGKIELVVKPELFI